MIPVLPWVTVVLTAGWLSQALLAGGVATRNARGVLGAPAAGKENGRGKR